MLEDHGPRSPAPPPSLRGTTYEASEFTAESRLAITGAPRDRQDEISGAMAALVVAGEEPGARASSGESLQQQGPPGTGASSKGSLQQQGPPGTGAFSDKSVQQQGPPRTRAFSGECENGQLTAPYPESNLNLVPEMLTEVLPEASSSLSRYEKLLRPRLSDSDGIIADSQRQESSSYEASPQSSFASKVPTSDKTGGEAQEARSQVVQE